MSHQTEILEHPFTGRRLRFLRTALDTSTPRPAARALFSFGLFVVAYNLGASVLAWTMGWPPQLGGDPDPTQPYTSYLLNGSAVSAPLPALLGLLAGVASSRRGHRWARLGLVLVTVVSMLFVIGALAEFVAEHPYVPTAAVFGLGGVNLVLAGGLLYLTARTWRPARTPGAPSGISSSP